MCVHIYWLYIERKEKFNIVEKIRWIKKKVKNFQLYWIKCDEREKDSFFIFKQFGAKQILFGTE